MNKNVQIAIGILTLVATGGLVYVSTSREAVENDQVISTPSKRVAPETPKSVAQSGVADNQAPRAVVNQGTPPPAPAEMRRPTNSLNYTCKGGKSFSVTFPTQANGTTTLSLETASGKKSLAVTPKVVGKDPAFTNEKSGITYINKGNYALITEGDKTTYDECKL
jgi:hypothetical protein